MSLPAARPVHQRLRPPNKTHLPRLETSSADKRLISSLVRHTPHATVIFASHIIREKENSLFLLIIPSPHFILTTCEGFCLMCNRRTMIRWRSGLCWKWISQNNRGNSNLTDTGKKEQRYCSGKRENSWYHLSPNMFEGTWLINHAEMPKKKMFPSLYSVFRIIQ